MSRINGKSFDVRMMGFKVHFESFNINITDNTTAASTKGRPDGVLQGDVSADGEVVVDSANFMLIVEAARAAGSFQSLPTFPIDAYGAGDNSGATELAHVNAFGCKLKISELLNIDPSSTDKTTHTLPFDVTGKDFILINGVPYLDSNELDLI